MVKRASDFRNKEVINISDGKRLGYVYDVEIDLVKGVIESIVVPGPSGIFNLFGQSGDYIIPWNGIKKIGDDIILVEYDIPQNNKK